MHLETHYYIGRARWYFQFANEDIKNNQEQSKTNMATLRVMSQLKGCQRRHWDGSVKLHYIVIALRRFKAFVIQQYFQAVVGHDTVVVVIVVVVIVAIVIVFITIL